MSKRPKWKPDTHGGWKATIEPKAGDECWVHLEVTGNDLDPERGTIAWSVVVHAEEDGACNGVNIAKTRALEAADRLIEAMRRKAVSDA